MRIKLWFFSKEWRVLTVTLDDCLFLLRHSNFIIIRNRNGLSNWLSELKIEETGSYKEIGDLMWMCDNTSEGNMLEKNKSYQCYANYRMLNYMLDRFKLFQNLQKRKISCWMTKNMLDESLLQNKLSCNILLPRPT